jgi:peptide deformylase
MAILPILHYPNERLKIKATPVSVFDVKLRQLIQDMAETMYKNNGLGLAANQVDVQLQIFIMDLAREGEPRRLKTFINPQISALMGEEYHEEGCLSVPGIFEKVKRATQITVNYQDEHGTMHTHSCSGLEAICIQHEIDHLNGKVFVEYLSTLKQNFIKKKMKKLFKNEQ